MDLCENCKTASEIYPAGSWMHNQAEVSALFLLIVFSADITVHLKLLAYFSSFLLSVSRLGWRMLCKTHANKLSSFSSSDDIVENKCHKYQEGI